VGLRSSECAWITSDKETTHNAGGAGDLLTTLELIYDSFQYVSKRLPNFYIAGWSWFYGRNASSLRSAERGERRVLA
jgi:hypothetical protein